MDIGTGVFAVQLSQLVVNCV
ncbi:Protein of unknown function [Bacillus cereus]|nr:Protein of unknown function [Bacillus cereus]